MLGGHIVGMGCSSLIELSRQGVELVDIAGVVCRRVAKAPLDLLLISLGCRKLLSTRCHH